MSRPTIASLTHERDDLLKKLEHEAGRAAALKHRLEAALDEKADYQLKYTRARDGLIDISALSLSPRARRIARGALDTIDWTKDTDGEPAYQPLPT